MKCLGTVSVLIMMLHISMALQSSQLQRLARLVLPYVGTPAGHHSLALARSLDGYSSLTRRQGEPEIMDTGMNDFEDEDAESINKRQFDDYGHMRFGRSTGGA
ncbi:hypothetical protein X975_11474, partial [Stegodyphus mimosarum]